MTADHRLIASAAALDAAVADLRTSLGERDRKDLYLDTEFESSRAGTRLCLVQVTAGDTVYLVDPFALKRLTPLGELASEPEVRWVLHAGLQDVDLLTRAFEAKAPARLFDTQIAWALTSAEPSVSLAYLQFRLLGLRTEKGHQADDWVRRPLQASQLRYAAGDVLHLPELTARLQERALELERLELVEEATSEALKPVKSPPPPLSLDSFRNAWQLSEKSQAAFRFLIEWVNGLSRRERKTAPEGKVLLSIASRCPENVGALSRIKGVHHSVVQQHGPTLIQGMARAVATAHSEDFVPLDPPPYATFEEIALDAWIAQWRSHLAISLEFAPEFVLPGRLIKDVKANLMVHGPQHLLDAVTGYRRRLIEAESDRFCTKRPPPV